MKKKKILLFSDDMRMSSGVGTMSREIIMGTAHHYDWIQVGGAVKHPEEGQMFDLSKDVNKELGIDNADVKVFPVSGYGNPDLLTEIDTYIDKLETATGKLETLQAYFDEHAGIDTNKKLLKG